MAQSKIVMAFRKRLLSRGYTSISIKYLPDFDSAFPAYLVRAVDPVFLVELSGVLTELGMRTALKKRGLPSKK